MLVKSEPGPSRIRSAAAIASRTSGSGLHFSRHQPNAANAHASGADARLAGDHFAVFQHGFERNELVGGGENAAANGQHFAADAHRAREIAGHVAQRGQEEIAEAVPSQTASGVETILKKPAQQGLILGQCDHAVANVAGRKDAVVAAQTPGTAAVIGNGYDCREIANGMVGVLLLSRSDVIFQSAQQRGKSRAAADGHNAHGPRALTRMNDVTTGRPSASRAVPIRVKEFGKSGIFLQEREVFIVAGVIAIFRTKLDGQFQIFHGRFGFSGQAIERGHGVDDVIRFGRQLAGAQQDARGPHPSAPCSSWPRPADSALRECAAMTGSVRCRRCSTMRRCTRARSASSFTGSGDYLFENGLGLEIFLLVEMLYAFFVRLQLLFGRRIDDGARRFLGFALS